MNNNIRLRKTLKAQFEHEKCMSYMFSVCVPGLHQCLDLVRKIHFWLTAHPYMFRRFHLMARRKFLATKCLLKWCKDVIITRRKVSG